MILVENVTNFENTNYITIFQLFECCLLEEFNKKFPNGIKEDEDDHPLIISKDKFNSILHHAVDYDNPLAIDMLIQFGEEEKLSNEWKKYLSIEILDNKLHSLLLRSILNGSDNAASILLQRGSNPLLKSKDGLEPYKEALRKKNSNILSQIQDMLRNGGTSYINTNSNDESSNSKGKVRKPYLTNANSAYFGCFSSSVKNEESVLEFFRNLDCTEEYYRSVINGSSLRQKIHLGRVRDATSNLFSSQIIKTKLSNNNTNQTNQTGNHHHHQNIGLSSSSSSLPNVNHNQQGGNVMLPHWARIFYQRLVLTSKILSQEKLNNYINVTQDFLKFGSRTQKDFNAVICAQSFIDYLSIHKIDPCNSLIGLNVNVNSIRLNIDILHSIYKIEKSLGIFKNLNHPFRYHQNIKEKNNNNNNNANNNEISSNQNSSSEEIIYFLKQWKNDDLLTLDDLKLNLENIIHLYEYEKELKKNLGK